MRTLLLALLLGCADAVAPKVCDDQHFRASVVARDATADFWAQLLSGTGNFVINGAVYVDSVELSNYVTLSNRITFDCAGGWMGQIVGTLTLKHTTDWEVVMLGCALHKGRFTAEYLQASRFYHTIIHEQTFVVEHSTDLTFRDPYIYDADIVLNDAGQVLIDGGYVGSSRISYTGTEGLNGWAGRMQYIATHTEFSTVTIAKAQSLDMERNVFIASHVNEDARKQNIQNNDWIRSTRNGKQVCG